MKFIYSIILIISICARSFYGVAYLGYYAIDQTNFIEQFCINKDKPKLKCNGKCHLSKQLVGDDKIEKNSENIIDLIIPLFLLNSITTKFDYFIEVHSTKISSILTDLYQSRSTTTYTPPPQYVA